LTFGPTSADHRSLFAAGWPDERRAERSAGRLHVYTLVAVRQDRCESVTSATSDGPPPQEFAAMLPASDLTEIITNLSTLKLDPTK
jgi:hypothetical protein